MKKFLVGNLSWTQYFVCLTAMVVLFNIVHASVPLMIGIGLVGWTTAHAWHDHFHDEEQDRLR